MRLSDLALVAALAGLPSGASAQEDPWLAQDKAQHFVASAVIAVGGYAFAIPIWACERPRGWLGAGISLTAGILKEVSDSRGNGQASWKDLAWDVLGVATAVGLMWRFDNAPASCSAPNPRPQGSSADLWPGLADPWSGLADPLSGVTPPALSPPPPGA